MNNIKETIAKNLVELRKKHKHTQSMLAEKLNYSDKAISRWERAETLPDIEVLCRICDLYGVRFEYLLQEEQPEDNKNPYINKDESAFNKISITLIALCTVWIVASVCFAVLNIYFEENRWTLFIWALPLTGIVAQICNRLWARNKVLSIVIASLINWTLILALFLEGLTYSYNFWMLFIIGAPVQMIIILFGTLKKRQG